MSNQKTSNQEMSSSRSHSNTPDNITTTNNTNPLLLDMQAQMNQMKLEMEKWMTNRPNVTGDEIRRSS
jgi:hypothetical protein